jgi:hypothetical protein
MNFRVLLMWGVVGWTAVGMLGVAVSLVRREWTKVRQGLAWITGVWIVYLGVLTGVSLMQPQRVLAIGQEQCFDEMCFRVTRVEEVPRLPVTDDSRLLRVSVQVRNKGRDGMRSEGRIRAYLMDSGGRRWEETAGVSGVRLTSKVMAEASVTSEPVFKVSARSTGLKLVFTRGWRQPGALVIGDSDSWLHRRTVIAFGR